MFGKKNIPKVGALLRRLLEVLGQNPKSDRKRLLERMPRDSVCAEIGVWEGDFSERILEIVKPRELHLIDPWEFQSEFSNRMYGGKVAKSQRDMETIYQKVRKRFEGNGVVTLHRGYSSAVLKTFEDGFFDWVYIDGNHYYEFVLRDLQLSWQKVRSGGFVTGDDYEWRPGDSYGEASGPPPIQRALKTHMENSGLDQAALMLIGSQYILERP